jgi:tRNA pseudouridine38-40 synthase
MGGVDFGRFRLGTPMRYRVDLAFHGAAFHGWQRQPGLRTVQGELEGWVQKLLRTETPITLTGAGRTDAGVHAEVMVAHFDVGGEFDHEDLTYRLSAALPDDLTVKQVMPVSNDFHARYSAIAKTYVYRLSTERTPFARDRVWHFHGDFDYDTAVAAANLIIGNHDFSGFCRAKSRKPNSACHVLNSLWRATETGYQYDIRANRFLHGMVRLLIGTMAEIARGRWPAARMTEILESCDVRLCGPVVPAHGLTLADIEYPVNA